MEKKAKDLVKGDKTPWYIVMEVKPNKEGILAQVQFNDGGIDFRQWDNPNAIIPLLEKE